LPGTLAYMLASSLSGRLIGSYGIGAFLLVGALVRGLGILGLALAPTWGLLLLVMFVAGLGTGVIDSGMNTFVATNYSAGRLSWLHACFGLGATFTPLIMTAILESSGPWQGGYVLVAVLQLLLAGAIVVTYRRWRINAPLDESNGQPTKAAPARATLLIPAVGLAILTFFMYTGVEVTGGNWTFTLFTEGRMIPTAVAGPWISLYWGSLTIGRVLSGLIVERLGELRLLRVSLVGVVLGAALITVPSETLSVAGMVLLGLAQAAIFPTLIAITPARFGAEHAANAIGFQIAAAGLGVAALPGLAGVLAQAIGLEVIGPFMGVAALIMFGLFEVGIRLAPPRNGKRPAAAG
jgi:fucose permease